MKIYLLSYSTPSFRGSQILLGISAIIAGCTDLKLRTQSNFIKTDFYKNNKKVLENTRGAGYWLWKYYFIAELMEQIEENDIIVYADSGVLFRRSLSTLLHILRQQTPGVLLFNNDYKNRHWTKRDCFVKLNCDNEEYYESPLIFGGLQLFQKNGLSVKFVKEVLDRSCSDDLITDEPNVFGLPDLPGFREHRHDQSITSLIAHQYGLKLYPDPSQFKTRHTVYEFPTYSPPLSDSYKAVVHVHRLSGLRTVTLPFKLGAEIFSKWRAR